MKSLYHEVIKQHQKQPYHFLKKEDAPLTLRANNPICGDRYDLFIEQEGKVLQPLHFHGYGCALSKASTSIMLKVLEGKTINEAILICHNFLDYIANTLEEEVYHPSFTAFEALHTQTARIDCVTLSWKELLQFLEQQNSKHD